MNFYLDPKVETSERQIYGLLEAFAQIGGIMGILVTVVSYLVKDIQVFLYNRAISHDLFVIDESQSKNSQEKSPKYGLKNKTKNKSI